MHYIKSNLKLKMFEYEIFNKKPKIFLFFVPQLFTSWQRKLSGLTFHVWFLNDLNKIKLFLEKWKISYFPIELNSGAGKVPSLSGWSYGRPWALRPNQRHPWQRSQLGSAISINQSTNKSILFNLFIPKSINPSMHQ